MLRFVSILLVVILASGCGGKVLPPETIFSEKGTYQSPNNVMSVQIKPGEKGQMRYRFVFPKGKPSEYIAFPADKAWFMCWDGRDRLWVHVPDVRTVYWYTASLNQLIPHEMMPPTAADLQLMPKPFKERLPEKMKPKPTPRSRSTR